MKLPAAHSCIWQRALPLSALPARPVRIIVGALWGKPLL